MCAPLVKITRGLWLRARKGLPEDRQRCHARQLAGTKEEDRVPPGRRSRRALGWRAAGGLVVYHHPDPLVDDGRHRIGSTRSTAQPVLDHGSWCLDFASGSRWCLRPCHPSATPAVWAPLRTRRNGVLGMLQCVGRSADKVHGPALPRILPCCGTNGRGCSDRRGAFGRPTAAAGRAATAAGRPGSPLRAPPPWLFRWSRVIMSTASSSNTSRWPATTSAVSDARPP